MISMQAGDRLALRTAVGAKTWRESLSAAQAAAKSFSLAFADVQPIYRAFAPMAREQTFDVSEMAIVTALQALAYDKPLLVLPVVVAARFQQGCLIKRKSDTALGVADLSGRKVGVRAYTQTTGVWLRGILQNDYGVAPSSIRWVTQEGAHLAEYRDPDWVEQTAGARPLVDLLRAGDADAVILGNDLPDDPDFAPVIPNPREAACDWYAKHGVAPINHVMVVRKDVAAAHTDAIRELWQVIHRAKPRANDSPDMTAIGVKALTPALNMLLHYCEQQKLLPRRLTVEDVFAETLAVLGDEVRT
jgi:4,5-dihydroxyphthalate decarboxylase